MSSDISLTFSQRNSLLTLQEIDTFFTRTQRRLSTGRDINDVTDDPIRFFQANNLVRRSGLFDERRREIDQAISTAQASLEGIESLDELFDQLVGVTRGARSQNQAERAQATENFTEILSQIDLLIDDIEYQGLNLLNNANTRLDVRFSDESISELTLQGLNVRAFATAADSIPGIFNFFTNGAGMILTVAILQGGGNVGLNGFGSASALAEAGGAMVTFAAAMATFNGFTLLGVNQSALAISDGLVDALEFAQGRLEQIAAQFGSRVGILQTRLDFSRTYSNTLQTGADKIQLADLSAESANLTALRTRNQISIETLSIASQQQEAILTLLR